MGCQSCRSLCQAAALPQPCLPRGTRGSTTPTLSLSFVKPHSSAGSPLSFLGGRRCRLMGFTATMGLEVLYPKLGETPHSPLKVEYVQFFKLKAPGASLLISVLLLSIVAVHGLNGHSLKTWNHTKSGVCWLEECLRSDMKAARIMSFGYNADAAFGITTTSTKDHVVDLLGSLLDVREEAEVSDQLRDLMSFALSLHH